MKSLYASILLGTVAVLSPRPAFSQSIVRSGEDLISIRAENATLAELLAELGELVEVEYAILSPEVRNIRVSLRLEKVHPVLGIHKLLEKAEVDYGVSGGDGDPFRIIVGVADLPSGGIARSESAAEYASDPYPDSDPDAYPTDGSPGTGGGISPRASQGPFGTAGGSGAQTASGMARPGSGGFGGVAGGMGTGAGAGTSPRNSSGTAIPGSGPGGFPTVPPGMQGTMPGGGASPAQTPQGRSPFRASGGAFFASDSAALRSDPPVSRVAGTGGILLFGLALGLVLVREPPGTQH